MLTLLCIEDSTAFEINEKDQQTLEIESDVRKRMS